MRVPQPSHQANNTSIAGPEETDGQMAGTPPARGDDPDHWMFSIETPMAKERNRRRDELEKALTTPRHWQARCSDALSRLVFEGACGVALASFNQLAYQALTPSRHAADPSGLHTNMSALSLSTFFGTSLANIGSDLRKAWTMENDDSCDHVRDIHNFLVKKYRAEKAGLPLSVSALIDETDRKIRVYMARRILHDIPDFMRTRQGLFLSMPTQTVDISYSAKHTGSQRGQSISQSVRALVEEYPPGIRSSLLVAIDQIRANSVLPKSDRVQLYLAGPPGTGKTRFAYRLGHTLGLPVGAIHIRPSDTLEDLVGGSYRSNAGFKNKKETASELKRLGQVPVAFLTAGCLNPILIFDELGDHLDEPSCVSAFKSLLDPNNRNIHISEHTGLNLDISRCTIIMTGNQTLSDPALASRCTSIHFDKIERQTRRDKIAQVLSFEKEQQQELAADIYDYLCGQSEHLLASLLAGDEASDIPGIRTALRVTKDAVAFHRARFVAGYTTTAAEEEAFIRAAFAGPKRLVGKPAEDAPNPANTAPSAQTTSDTQAAPVT